MKLVPIPDTFKFKSLMNARFVMYKNFLDAHAEYERVFVSDVRDVIFQEDLFARYAGYKNFLVYAAEAMTIRNQLSNRIWLQDLFGEAEYQKIADRTVVCAGTILGSRAEMLILFEKMIGCFKNREETGEDQATLNYLVHNKLLPIENIIESNVQTGEILTIGIVYWDKVGVGKILRGDGKVPAVVHQYDRHAPLTRFVDEIYLDQDFQPDENFLDARSAFDQVICLIHRKNLSAAMKIFVSHVLYSTDFKNDNNKLIGLWEFVLASYPSDNLDAEILLAVIQRAIVTSFSANIDFHQLERLNRIFTQAVQSSHSVSTSFKIFLAKKFLEGAAIFYQNKRLDWCSTYIERVVELGFPVAQDVYLLQAKVYRELGKKDAALKAYEKALNAT